MDSLHIDCDRCVARGHACSECVVSALLDAPAAIDLTLDERQAIANLAAAGLVPPMRMQALGPGTRQASVSSSGTRQANGTDG